MPDEKIVFDEAAPIRVVDEYEPPVKLAQMAEPLARARFEVSCGGIRMWSDELSISESKQFMLDAVSDMATVLAQGKKYNTRPEPADITKAVEAGIDRALHYSAIQEERYLEARLADVRERKMGVV